MLCSLIEAIKNGKKFADELLRGVLDMVFLFLNRPLRTLSRSALQRISRSMRSSARLVASRGVLSAPQFLLERALLGVLQIPYPHLQT